MRKELDMTAVLAMLVLCVIWGAQQPAIKLAAVQVDPLVQLSGRSLIAALLLYGLARWRGIDCLRRDAFFRPGLLAGLLFAGEFCAMAIGLYYTSAAHIVVFIYTAPLFAAFGLHGWVPGEQLRPRQWLGIALAMLGIGIALLIGQPPIAGAWRGDLIGLLGGACWGATTVLIRCTALADAPPLRTLFYQASMTGAVLAILTGVLGKSTVVSQWGGVAWFSLAFQVLIVATASLLAWLMLLGRYRAAPLGVLTLLTPLFGVGLCVVLLGETPGPGFLFGAALVLSGLLVVSYPSRMPDAAR